MQNKVGEDQLWAFSSLTVVASSARLLDLESYLSICEDQNNQEFLTKEAAES